MTEVTELLKEAREQLAVAEIEHGKRQVKYQTALMRCWAALRRAALYDALKQQPDPNARPFYQQATIRFTTDRVFSRPVLEELLDTKLRHPHIIKYSVEVVAIAKAEIGAPEDL